MKTTNTLELCLGQKVMSVLVKKQHMQKQLFLVNLKELYSSLLKEHASVKIGFSKFCQLQPKWWVLLGASGTHRLCVCIYHQNRKLILDPLSLGYKDLLKFLLCDPGNKHCMINWCPSCPGDEEQLYVYLKETIESLDISDWEIKFCQWTTTDRANLINCVENVETYIENVIKKVHSITIHSYLAKAQSEHLQKLKNKLKSDSIISLGDFAGNYEFVVQDEVQSFHWKNLQATLHPVVIYYKENEKLKYFSYCVISDDMEHDAAMVYQVQNKVLKKVIADLPKTKEVTYFSDRCASQYKSVSV